MRAGHRGRRSMIRRLPAFLAILALATVAWGCGDDGGNGGGTEADVESGPWGGVINRGGTPVKGGHLRIDMPGEPEGLSPLQYLESPSVETFRIGLQVFDQLVEFEPGSLDPQPALAEDWEISEDGLRYEFRLRDAKFSNGMPVTSADVKFSLRRAKDSFFVDLYEAISRIETPDESTVVLTLSEPTPALLDYLGTMAASIMPAKVVESVGAKTFNESPVGSGPFVVERWRRGQQVELARNERYWREGFPYLNTVTIASVDDDNTRVLNVESGTSDVADQVPFSQVESIDNGGAASVLVTPGADMYAVFMNNSVEPFDEVEVRRALNYATPVDAIIDVVFKGLAPARMNTIIPKLKYWSDEVKPYTYDPERARKLLASSSVPDGFSVKLNIPGGDQPTRQTAQIIQDAWAEIGVEMEIRTLDDATHTEGLTSGNYELTLDQPGDFTTDVPVDDQFAKLLFDSPAISNLFTFSKLPEVARLTRQATVELDEERRADLFERMHAESMENAPVIPLVYTPNRAAVGNNVHDFNYLLLAFWRLESVWVE